MQSEMCVAKRFGIVFLYWGGLGALQTSSAVQYPIRRLKPSTHLWLTFAAADAVTWVNELLTGAAIVSLLVVGY